MMINLKNIIPLWLSLTTLGFISSAMAEPEQEPNDPIASAQLLTIPSSGTVTISGVLGTIGGVNVNDLDYYVFEGSAGDIITVDIDNGIGGAQSFDSIIALFGVGSGYTVLAQNDDAPQDPGSISQLDSRIENFHLPVGGQYTIGVTNYPRFFINGGSVRNVNSVQNGDYTLILSGVSPTTLDVTIDIKPGSDVNPINPNSRGKVPVAVLSNAQFDAVAQITATSVTFGVTGDEASLAFCDTDGEDVNDDGRYDLVCHFTTAATGLTMGHLEAVLKGTTVDGQTFIARDFIKVMPSKK